VTGVASPVTSARLRLFVTDASPDGGTLYSVASAWTETGITWANAPAMSASPVASTPGKAAAGAWIEWDVRPLVTGDGTYRFALTTSSSNSLYASSREGSSPPQLVVDTRPPDPPVAAFTVNVTSGYAPLSVRFTDASTGATSWAWDVQNDGTTDTTAQNPMVTYPTAGTYSVRLTASNSVGSNTVVRDGLITVVEPPPPGPVTGVLVGAGDIADCTLPNDEATAAVVDGIAGTVFAAGDTVYESGSPAEYTSCYDPTWGRHRARTLPAVGNHEYQTSGATGYYGYFGAAAGDPTKGYYSTDVGGWHVVVLNSNCTKIVGGCAAGGAQETWLRADLAASTATCTVAIWHHPMFSSGSHGINTSVRPLWAALDAAGADVVIVGHDHDYERFAPQTASGTADPAFGIRSFVVGTGGAGLRGFATTAANSEVRDSDTFGVLKLTLHASSYDWAFVPVAGSTFTDTGSTPCHGRPPSP
jgi:PKD repeat protein